MGARNVSTGAIAAGILLFLAGAWSVRRWDPGRGTPLAPSPGSPPPIPDLPGRSVARSGPEARVGSPSARGASFESRREPAPASPDPQTLAAGQPADPGPITGAVLIEPKPPATLEARNKLLEALSAPQENVRFGAILDLEAHLKIHPEDEGVARAIEHVARTDEASHLRATAFGVLFGSPDPGPFAAALDVILRESDPHGVRMELSDLALVRTSAYQADLLEYQMTSDQARRLAEERVPGVLAVLERLESTSASAEMSSAVREAVETIRSGK